MDWTVTGASVKGGPGKTTTSFHLAAFMAKEGRTILVDGNSDQGSALKWVGFAELNGESLPFEVVTWENVPSVEASFVVDTPPADNGIARAALRMADVVVVPVSPTLLDVAQLPETRAMVEACREQNPDLREFYLLTKVKGGTREARDGRVAMENLVGECLLDSEVPDWVSVGRTFGHIPDLLGPYAGVWAELKGRMVA